MHLTLDKNGSKSPAMLGTMSHTTTAAEATANAITLTTEATVLEVASVSIKRAGIEVLGDAVVTYSGSNITITDGASTYAATADDEVFVLFVGGA